ncbi:hypothetical protein DFQ05_1969 [Winogradskyella wandonensis]|uniref:Lipoprotein n=1 Tax=Winogradskyella wandonensis TaxID=1442586 RepID=A0A4R1KNR5_9FLAO|nr:hypothetical protein [Winogradskyella wandonensis]TCK66695.1 hypothetical protein DFQ05_1969 [Winogradskyella wandonensis]
MRINKSIPLILCCLTLLLQSCKGDIKVDSIFENEAPKNTLIGEKHFLEEDGIQLQLPENFKRLSIAEYSEILEKKSNKSKFLLERQELKNTRSLNGNSYIFRTPEGKSSYFVNTIPYSEIKKEDAQKLLGIIRQNQDNVAENYKVEFSKVTAKFKSITGAQIFKAVFKANFKRHKQTQYQHTYFINSNQKSVLLNLITTEDIDFDKYIQKMIF